MPRPEQQKPPAPPGKLTLRPGAGGGGAKPPRGSPSFGRGAPKPNLDDIIGRIQQYDATADHGLKIALYGVSGTGKTTFWSTFPAPILAIICSGGRKQAGELQSLGDRHSSRVRTVTLQQAEELLVLGEWLQGGGAEQYRTIVLDHASGFQDLILGGVIGKPVPEQKEWGLASREQWGQVGAKFKEYLKPLIDVPQNVVIVAHQRNFKEDESKSEIMDVAPRVGAALSPSTCGWLNGAVDYVCQTFIKPEMKEKVIKVGKNPDGTDRTKKAMIPVAGKVKFCLRVAPDGYHMIKFRIPLENIPEDMPDIEDPNYAKVFSVLKGREPDAYE